MANSNGLTNKEENRFWLRIFSDKSNVLKQRFAPEYTSEISQLKLFASSFFELAKKARKDLTEEQTSEINIDASRVTGEFKHFTTGILRRQLLEDFYISITPAETNSIINTRATSRITSLAPMVPNVIICATRSEPYLATT